MKLYMAGWNVPGFIPVAEPGEFDDFEQAKEHLVSHLETMEEMADLDDCPGQAKEYFAAKNIVKQWEDTDEAKLLKLPRELYWIQIAKLNSGAVL